MHGQWVNELKWMSHSMLSQGCLDAFSLVFLFVCLLLSLSLSVLLFITLLFDFSICTCIYAQYFLWCALCMVCFHVLCCISFWFIFFLLNCIMSISHTLTHTHTHTLTLHCRNCHLIFSSTPPPPHLPPSCLCNGISCMIVSVPVSGCFLPFPFFLYLCLTSYLCLDWLSCQLC